MLRDVVGAVPYRVCAFFRLFGGVRLLREEQAPPLPSLCAFSFVRRWAFVAGGASPSPYGVCAFFRLYGGGRLLQTTNGRPYKMGVPIFALNSGTTQKHSTRTKIYFSVKVLRGSKGNFFKSSPWRVPRVLRVLCVPRVLRVFKRFVLCR